MSRQAGAARGPGRLFHICAALIFLSGTPLAAQRIAVPDAPERQSVPVERRVSGRVVRPAAEAMVGVVGAWTTLHRVGSDGGAPVDSMRTRAGGTYEFRFMSRPGDDAVYFVSASHGGIAYFSPPLAEGSVGGDDAEITVFDTTSAPIPIQVRGRHLVVSAPADGKREIIEVYELSNDSSLTFIAPDTTTPTWTAILPEAAEDFRVGEGDVAEAAVEFEKGRLRVFAPIAPGLKQIAVSYVLPAGAFPLAVPVERATPVFEILIEDPAGSASGAGIVEVDPVSAEGRTFRRFLGADAPANGVVELRMPQAVRFGRGTYLAIVLLAIGTAMLIVLARSFSRRRSLAPGRVELPDDPDRLAREVAALDAAFERMPSATDEARAAYESRRQELKHRLAVALARRGAPR